MAQELLTATLALQYLGLQFLIFFPVGYMLLGHRMGSIPFVLRLPVFLSSGMVVVDILMVLVGTFYIGNLVLPVIAIISYSLLTFKFVLRIRKERSNLRLALPGLPSLVTIFVMVLVIAHFSSVAGHMVWPPPGDLAVHGFLTSLLIHNGKLQSSLTPIESGEPWHEPFGLHVLSANLSFTLEIFPAISLMVLGTTIVILILFLIYSTVYIMTRSVIFAVLALVSGFAVSSIGDLEYWLLGYYYNGPYANLFGYLCLFLYVAIQFALPSLNNSNGGRLSIGSIVSLIGILLVYPPIVIIPVIHLVAVNIYARRATLWKSFKAVVDNPLLEKGHKAALNIGLIFFIIIAVLSLIGILPGLQELENTITSMTLPILIALDRTESLSFFYSLSLDSFLTNEVGRLAILTMFAAVIAIINRRFVYLSSFYLFVSTMVILSSWEVTDDYLWSILPRRLFVFLGILNWIVLFTYLRPAISWLINSMKIFLEVKNKPVPIKIIRSGTYIPVVIAVVLIFLPNLISHATLQQAESSGWFSRSETFRNDYEMLVWIHKNIGFSELIMVDNSYTSLFINSLSLKNLTAYPISLSEPSEIERSVENRIVWERPEVLKQFIDMYDIKYVLLLSDPLEYHPTLLGGEGKYHIKKYASSEYQRIFNELPYLEPLKSYGNATIYKVK